MDGDLNTLAFRAAAGDRDALERICIEIQDSVYRLALRFLSSPEDAEDCTQEILIQVITHLGSFEGRSKFTTWVYTIASRHLMLRLRPHDRPEHHVRHHPARQAGLHLLERERPTQDSAAFRRAADQLDIAERFAGLFRHEPQFQAPASVLAELRRRCPDLLGEMP